MRRTLILLAIVAGLVAACGGSTATGALLAAATQAGATQDGATQAAPGVTAVPTNGPATALDACTLITTDEAAAAVGQPVAAGVVPEPGAHSCLFATQVLSADGVEISITGLDTFNPTQKSIPGLTITPVSGIGDAAYYLSMGAGSDVLEVRKGSTTFSVSILRKGASDVQLQGDEKTLALAILGRI
jgi:hypothetical protein